MLPPPPPDKTPAAPRKGAAKPPAVPPPSAAAANAAAASFAQLTQRLSYLGESGIEQVRRAYRFADAAHLGVTRKSGEPYITHPIAVAAQCAEWKLDAHALMAALLHDTIEDCGVTKAELVERFGAPVADMVDGLTKLDKLHFNTREEKQAESFRKMLLAMARDVRVILIKLADRLHNMRTLGDMSRSSQARISTETLDIYVPIAHRLGLNATYRELQDLSFRHLEPWRYETLRKALQHARHRRRDLLAKVRSQVEAAFAKAGLTVRLLGREKQLYSIYRKMRSKHLSFAQVSDIYGFRVIVDRVTDCYTGLGVLHQLYKPMPGKFKDYIAIPKINGYQSLHTTLLGPAEVAVEFQLRTEAMDLVAESGVAAHWLYKAPESTGGASPNALGTKWLQSLLDIQQETHDAAEFWDHVKVDLFPDAVYVFTPRGQIMALPRGATVVDFAYAIHSDVGDRTVGARIGGEQVPLRTELRNGDVVEVVTAPVSAPNPAWLGFVRTGRARSKIRHHLKSLTQTDAENLGLKLLTQAVRAEGVEQLPARTEASAGLWERLLRFTGNRTAEELMADIGLGKQVASIVAKRMVTLMTQGGAARPDAVLLSRERFTAHENVSQGAVLLDGQTGGTVKYAPCCHPVPGDAVVGYLGRGEGLVVHRENCPQAQRLLARDSERFIAVAWAEEPVRNFEAAIVVRVNSGKGVLAKVAATIAGAEVDILHLDMGHESAKNDTVDLRFLVAVRDVAHLDLLLRDLARSSVVLKAFRAEAT